MTSYPTLEAHREILQSAPAEALAAASKKLRLSGLTNAWTYHVDAEAVRSTQFDLKRLHIPLDKHIWMEFSQPLAQESYNDPWPFDKFNQELRTRPIISALFFHCPALECVRFDLPATIPNFQLDLVATGGDIFDTFLYYPKSSQRWGLSRLYFYLKGCGCTHTDHTELCLLQLQPCFTPCNKHASYLNTWRNRFRRAWMSTQTDIRQKGL